MNGRVKIVALPGSGDQWSHLRSFLNRRGVSFIAPAELNYQQLAGFLKFQSRNSNPEEFQAIVFLGVTTDSETERILEFSQTALTRVVIVTENPELMEANYINIPWGNGVMTFLFDQTERGAGTLPCFEKPHDLEMALGLVAQTVPL